jgi:hypothetical protein
MKPIVALKRPIVIETQGQEGVALITAKPILYFMAINRGKCQQIAAYSEADAQERAKKVLGGFTSFYQVFPVDVDYRDYPEVQALKDVALGGFGGSAA